MTSPKKAPCIIAFAVFLMSAALAAAQGGGPQLQFMKNGRPDVSAQLNFVLKSGPKGSANAGTDGTVSIPAGILSSNKTHFTVVECPDGTLYSVEDGAEDMVPCPKHRRKILGGYWSTDSGVKTFNEVVMTGGGFATSGGSVGDSGLYTSAMVDVAGGAAFYTDFNGLCQNAASGTCTHGSNVPKFYVGGAVLFGNGPVRVGGFGGFETRGEVGSTLDESSGESTSTETLKTRVNTYMFGARAYIPVGNSPFGLTLDGGVGINSLRFRERFTSGSETSSFEDSSVLMSPLVRVGVQYHVSPCVSLTAMYGYSHIHSGGSSGGGSSSGFSIGDNDFTAGVTFNFPMH